MTKEFEFSSKILEMAAMSKIFSHPARIQIIDILSKHKDRTCKEIVGELPLSQSTVSQHLKELLEVGIICRKKEGSQSLYCIEWNKLERLFKVYEMMQTKVFPNRPKRNCC